MKDRILVEYIIDTNIAVLKERRDEAIDYVRKLEADYAALVTAARELVLALNNRHTIDQIHPDVFEAIRGVNRVLDAELLPAAQADTEKGKQ